MTAENIENSSGIEVEIQPVPQEVAELSLFQKTRGWAGRHKWQLALAGIATSACLTWASDDSHETIQEATENLPGVAVGIVAMEAMWIGGAGMMAASVGNKIKNPLKIKKQFPEIAKQANDSKLFTAGFWTNTVGAVGEFVIPTVAVVSKMPPETWGILSPSVIDLGITIAIRKAIIDGVRSADGTQTEDSTPEV
jgi:hypothetical protein